MNDEMKSPPYPKDSCTVPLLLVALAELRDWLLYYRDWANGMASEYSGKETVIVPEHLSEIMDQNTYVRVVAILDTGRIYIALRGLREHWDHVLRIHEDSWESRLAVSQRLHCVHSGYALYLDAFLTPEVREARSAATSKRSHTAMRQLMQKLGMPENGMLTKSEDGEGLLFSLQPEDNPGIDFDGLFHGTDKLNATDKLDESSGETQEN